MAKKRSRRTSPPEPGARHRPSRSSSLLRARPVVGEKNVWELLHPRCALDRAADMEEVEAMVAGGELEIAMDELRWLLGGCSDFLDAHRLLGELAMVDGDIELARGHFGIAFHLGVKAAGKTRGAFPYSRPDNRSFLESGKGLVAALLAQGKIEMAREAALTMLKFDPTDPLGVRPMMDATK